MFNEKDNKCMAPNRDKVQKCLEKDLAGQQKGQRCDFDKFWLLWTKHFASKWPISMGRWL
jgi:hypothetical protein